MSWILLNLFALLLAVSSFATGTGNVSAVNAPRGNTTWFGYDGAGRSAAVTNALGQVTRTFPDASGNVTSVLDALGRSTQFIYDSLNRRVQTVFADGTTQTSYFDDIGRRTHGQDQAGQVTAFGYDALGRLSSVTNAFGQVTRYAHDELGELIAQTDANNHTTAFEYDSLGRRVRRTLPGNQVETYAYNGVGNLIQQTDYNGDGTRVGKTVNGVTMLYLVDELNPTGYAQVVEELTSTGGTPAVTRTYTLGHTLVAQDQVIGGQWQASFYGFDGHNSVRYLTDLTGHVTDTFDYDAFGNLIARSGTTPNNYLYTGEQFDPDLGLYYLRARYHNPNTGRFWSMDSF